ncbi:MAG: DUF2974 domain-containing protein [Lachnospiraceae bacterium]|nr:DUF2974 domain-containing protein [Lachnospiraceae bacterium]
MGTIIDYLKEYGDYTLMEKAFSEVDSLALGQFAYLKFDGLAPTVGEDKPMVSLKDLYTHKDYDNLYGDERYREDNTALFLGLYHSKRFHDMKVWNYVNWIDLKTETQFSAVTFRLPDGVCYVAYRGTDESIVGWKEDLNLAFSEPVLGQRMSVDYLNRVAKDITGSFYVGGHSKGGNLATYACMNCDDEVRDRILAIYDHDGPGFRPEVKERGAYDEIADRIHKTIPHSSLVGMLLYSDGAYRVVESKTIGLAQHNPYTWLIKEDHFKIVNELYAGRKFLDEALNQWILSLSQEQMQIFSNTLYQVVLASETDNLIDFTANWFKSIHKIGTAMKEIDSQTRKNIMQIMKSLFDIISLQMKERMKSKNEHQREKFDQGIAQLEQMFTK